MKLKNYIKDKTIEITILIVTYIIMLLLFIAFKINISLIIALSVILLFSYSITFTISYLRKKTFYDNLVNNIKLLDKAYLVLETINEPNFYEGKIISDILYDINKSYIENIHDLENQVKDFKNYIEMWIHEIKIPVSYLTLNAHNNKDKFKPNDLIQIKKIDDYLEQVLYYVRSENASSDYLINKVNLKKCINEVALKNKDYLLESKVDLIVTNVDYNIYTDSKWLEFIINQIINNSIKYKKDNCESYIKIYAIKDDETITLTIEDNGIGIIESDIKRVFEKSFTGTNGRIKNSSTGMGLFIVKNLCIKLGHIVRIESKKDEYTKVHITISTNKYYEVTKQ